MIKKLYDTNQFLVGELYIIKEIEKDFSAKKSSLMDYRAVKFQDVISWEHNFRYLGYLTVFYDTGSGYLCLHNNMVYQLEGKDFCRNLMPITQILPKISYNCHDKMSIMGALGTFDKIFGRNGNSESLYNSKTQLFNKMQIGIFHLATGIIDANCSNGIERKLNVIDNQLLLRSSARLLTKRNYIGNIQGNGLDYDKYYYSDYYCLLLREKESIINLNNHQVYVDSLNCSFRRVSYNLGESYYDSLTFFKKVLDKQGLNYNREMSISKTLGLFKKYSSKKQA